MRESSVPKPLTGTAEPASGNRFFRFIMKVRVPEIEPDAKEGIMCPKLSWSIKSFWRSYQNSSCYSPTKNAEFYGLDYKKDIPEQGECKIGYDIKASCYSIAGLDRDALVPCWENEEGKWLYLPDNTDGRGPERMGCKSLSPQVLKPGTNVEFEFLTNRLGYFRLLPASDEERARVRDWRKPGSTFVSPEGICEVVPDSSRWAYRFGEDGTVFGRMICRDDGDCREGQLCEQLEGCQPGLGLCKDKALPVDR